MSKDKTYEQRLAEIQPDRCTWNDHGIACTHAGVVSFSTQGGPWYCRQHADEFRGLQPAAVGNQITSRPTSRAIQELRSKWTLVGKRYKPLNPVQGEEAAA